MAATDEINWFGYKAPADLDFNGDSYLLKGAGDEEPVLFESVEPIISQAEGDDIPLLQATPSLVPVSGSRNLRKRLQKHGENEMDGTDPIGYYDATHLSICKKHTTKD
ncbi:hypothetical protein BX070DRAFT_254510 [Coemansia spiralis]|nr:hypothetical protein BX070DRAFT_254510 [Coemansia spiralis]